MNQTTNTTQSQPQPPRIPGTATLDDEAVVSGETFFRLAGSTGGTTITY